MQAQKTMYSLIKNSRQLLLPIDIIFQLFDHTVVPIFYMVVWLRIVTSLKNSLGIMYNGITYKQIYF